MMGPHKFSLKRLFLITLTLAIFFLLTWRSQASSIELGRIYTALTTDTIKKPLPDTIKRPAKDSVAVADTSRDSLNHPSPIVPALKSPIDSLADSLNRMALDTIPAANDTFALRLSKDTLDAPVVYEAEDSAVVFVEDKKIILYGTTKTTHRDATLTAPIVELNQETNVMTAVNEVDSAGEVLTRARFEQGENKFESDTIRFNFKTQQGLTKNTYTQQDEMFVHGETIKKVNESTIFIKDGRFTTCNLDDPHFDFRAKRMKVVNNKVAVTGFVQLAFEDVPIPKPVGLPFGIFPLSRGRHSGLLQTTIRVTEDFGLGLEGFGYYKVLNDNIDVTLRGNVYSYGGWTANLTSSYRKRYRYNGAVNLSLQHTKLNFKGDPDYSTARTFFVNWNHTMDQRARPGTVFSANVRAGSSKYNTYVLDDPYRNFNNNFGSSIMYQKTWVGKPYNLSMGATHDQNTQTRLINVRLPDASFTVTTLYPFQRKEAVGTPKWYEKLGVGYMGSFRNQLSFYDTAVDMHRLMDTLQWGASHRVPISLSLPQLGPFNVAPSFSYEEQWLQKRTLLDWDTAARKLDTTTQKGFYTARNISVGLSFNTAIFGTFQFKKSKRIAAIRHVMRPDFGFSYTPNLARSYWDVVQFDSAGRTRPYSQFAGNLVSQGYSNVRFGGISFGLDNNLEMKVRSKEDTSANAFKKVRLIDGFGFRSGYNFLEDSFQLQNFALYLRSTLFEKINLTASASLDPYKVDSFGRRVNELSWRGGNLNLGRVTYGSITLSTQFKSKPKDPSKQPQTMNTQPQITDPTLLADQQRLMEYMQRNPSEFVDFNVPWDIGLDFSLNYSRQYRIDLREFVSNLNSSFNFRNSFSLTPKWNFTTNGMFSFDSKKLEMFMMSINRDLHCWQMSISVVPVGLYRSFSITINPKSGMLQDLRVNRSRTFTNF